MMKIVVSELVTKTAGRVASQEEASIADFFKQSQLDKLKLTYDVFSYD